jgi:hypothetical protein
MGRLFLFSIIARGLELKQRSTKRRERFGVISLCEINPEGRGQDVRAPSSRLLQYFSFSFAGELLKLNLKPPTDAA